MELYNYQNNRRRHYKSKSAAAVLSNSKIIPFRPRTETTSNQRPRIPGSFQLIQGYTPHIHTKKQTKNAYNNSQRHYKNTKNTKTKHTHHKSTQKPLPKIHNIQLPNDWTHSHSHKNKYRVPANTPSKYDITYTYAQTHTKYEPNTHDQNSENQSLYPSPPLSLQANATIYPSSESNKSMSDGQLENISNIGVRYSNNITESFSDSHNSSPCYSLRILDSVSSISSLAMSNHKLNGNNNIQNLHKLGIQTVYIDSFRSYFGHNAKELGHGGQGSIYKINESHVLKSYSYTSLGLYREIFALKHILNKDIKVYIENAKKLSLQRSRNGSNLKDRRKAFIEFPLIRGENLMEYSQDLINNKKTSLRECHLQALFAQLFVSLYELHSKGLIHRDIKIENVMVRKDGSIEFIDFGHAIYIAKDLNSETYANFKLKWIKGKTEIFGTDCVLCPELKYAFYELQSNEYILYGTEIDFYSVGIMGVEIIYNIFDHAYQHSKWVGLLQKDIAQNGEISGLSVQCLQFLLGLIDTNPSKRLHISEILSHPFLTEEVIDKLGYDNWYSDDGSDESISFVPFIDDDSIVGDLPITHCVASNIKQELIKHKINIICKGLLDEKLTYYPRIQHLNKLIAIIKECSVDNAKDKTYLNIPQFILGQFEKPFQFQLQNYNPMKNKNNIEKINRKKISLHKKLYQVITEFITSYKSEFVERLREYVSIMIGNNGLSQHFIACMHKIIKTYSFEYQTCLILLQILNKKVMKQTNKRSTIKIRQQCILFLKFLLLQYRKLEKKDSMHATLKHPAVLSLIESIIKYGLTDKCTKTESESLLRTFKELDDALVFKHHNSMKLNRIKKQNLKTKHKKSGTHNKIDALGPKILRRCITVHTPQIQRNENKVSTTNLKKNKSLSFMDRSTPIRRRSKSKSKSKSTKHKKSKSQKRKLPKYSQNKYKNKNGFVTESVSEIPHLKDICAYSPDNSM